MFLNLLGWLLLGLCWPWEAILELQDKAEDEYWQRGLWHLVAAALLVAAIIIAGLSRSWHLSAIFIAAMTTYVAFGLSLHRCLPWHFNSRRRQQEWERKFSTPR